MRELAAPVKPFEITGHHHSNGMRRIQSKSFEGPRIGFSVIGDHIIGLKEPHLIDPGARQHTDEELRAFLKPVPPKPIAEVLRSFECIKGCTNYLIGEIH